MTTPLDARHVLAAAETLGLPIPDDCLPGVVTYFRLAAGMAERVTGLTLSAHDEPAPVFVPIGPDDEGLR